MTEIMKTTEEVKQPEIKKSIKPPEEADHTKEKLLTFKRYKDRRDLLTALLDDDRRYTIKEADAAIENFMKGGVK